MDEDGTETNPDLITKSDLCIPCKEDEGGRRRETLCMLTRVDRRMQEVFFCEAYEYRERE